MIFGERKMRSDFVLYTVAAFFFALTVIAVVIITEAERSLWVVSTAVLGILSVGLGYYQRPQANAPAQKTPARPTKSTQTEQVPVVEALQVAEVPIQQPKIEQTPPIIETPPTPIVTPDTSAAQTETAPIQQPIQSPLTKVKGIGEKRAAQLNAIGINTIDELAKSSIDEIANNLKVSPKIVTKWVEAAKQA
jgi:predicted flap endonuclease-1-like 5' DNA nuclease